MCLQVVAAAVVVWQQYLLACNPDACAVESNSEDLEDLSKSAFHPVSALRIVFALQIVSALQTCGVDHVWDQNENTAAEAVRNASTVEEVVASRQRAVTDSLEALRLGI